MIVRAKREGLISRSLSDKAAANKLLNEIETKEGRTVLASYPRRILLELTNACNLRCRMCGREAADFHPRYIDKGVVDYICRELDAVEEITLMGWGEPTLHPDLAEIMEKISSKGISSYMCTNGMKLTELAELLVKSGPELLSVSINGAKEETNDRLRRGSSLRKILDGIDEVNRAKRAYGKIAPYLSFVYCLMRSNINEFPETVELAARHGVSRVKAVHLTAFSPSLKSEILYNEQSLIKDIFLKAEELADKYSIELELPYIQGEDPAGELLHGDCCAPWRDMFIGSDMILRPCMSTEMTLGTFDMTKDFFDIWNSPSYQRLRATVNGTDMPKQCERCYQATFCNWNRYRAYYQAGEEFSHDWK